MIEPSAQDPHAPSEPAEVEWWIRTITANAAALRAAGVGSIAVGKFSAVLQAIPAAEPKYDPITADAHVPDGLPAIHDPHSYPGGYVPGLTIERLTITDED
jgi:hypothetical protein